MAAAKEIATCSEENVVGVAGININCHLSGLSVSEELEIVCLGTLG